MNAAVAEKGRVDDYLESVGCFGGYDGVGPVYGYFEGGRGFRGLFLDRFLCVDI